MLSAMNKNCLKQKKITDHKEELISDVLLDQDIFSGVGNIIKNEVLYRTRVNRNSIVGKILSKKIKEMVDRQEFTVSIF